MSDEFLRETRLPLIQKEIGDMNKFRSLFLNRFRHRRMAVSETAYRDSRGKIQILFSGGVIKITSLTANEKQICAGVGLHHIFFIQCADFFQCHSVHFFRPL